MDGILLVDKPKGWTSFDVVAKVRGILRHAQKDLRSQSLEHREEQPKIQDPRSKIKVGHTGTLDPSAAGLLVLCIGKYTKKVEQMIRHDKTYEVELTLGATSTTGDQEGQIVHSSEFIVPNEAQLIKVLHSFVGEQMQTPPAFSAIKVDGKRAYDLARAGKEVKLEPRKITIHSIELTEFSYPALKFTCEVSSGTYIRSLAEDIGTKLGTSAYMSELRRTKVADFEIAEALQVNDLNIESITRCLKV